MMKIKVCLADGTIEELSNVEKMHTNDNNFLVVELIGDLVRLFDIVNLKRIEFV